MRASPSQLNLIARCGRSASVDLGRRLRGDVCRRCGRGGAFPQGDSLLHEAALSRGIEFGHHRVHARLAFFDLVEVNGHGTS